MLGYLCPDIICSEKRTLFRERSSRKTVSFEEQIMSKDKYLSIFSKSNGGYCVYYPSNIFTTRAVLKIGEYSRIFPSFCWGTFGHVTCSDQSRAGENIWWTIKAVIIHQIFSLARDWSKHVTWPNIPASAKTGEYPRIFPNFQNCACCEKDLKDNKHNSLHFTRKYARIFVRGHYLFR